MTEKLQIAVKTHVGMVRSENQDHFGVFRPQDAEAERRKGNLVVVADGMGGHSGGQVASQTATETMIATFTSSQLKSMQELLEESILAGNEAVKAKQEANPQLREMGTTCVSALVRGSRLLVAHLGDSRCYLFRGDTDAQVTRDHTYLNELIDIGLLTPEQATGHPDKNIITRCVGMSQRLEIDYNLRELEPGDIIAMCSDGLSNMVSIEETGQIARSKEPEEACEILIDLANERGGDDNITIALIKVNELPEEDDELVKLDAARETETRNDNTPIIDRGGENARGDDSEADTAEGVQRPDTRMMRAQDVDPELLAAETQTIGPGGDATSTLVLGSSDRAWYWLIGAEVLLLVILQFWIGRF